LGTKIISELYHYGVLNEAYNFPDDRLVVILEGRVKKHNTQFSNLIKLEDVKSVISKKLSEQNLDAYNTLFVSLFFDLVEPNLTYNESFTEKALKDDLDKLSYVRGSIEKGTVIISKGE